MASDEYEHLTELEKNLSKLRHPSGDQVAKVHDTVKWFNSLKPDQKSDVFLSLIGMVVRDELS